MTSATVSILWICTVVGMVLTQRLPHHRPQQHLQHQQPHQQVVPDDQAVLEQRNYERAQHQPQPEYVHQQQQQQQHYRESTTFVPIIRFEKDQAEDGSYKTLYETGNHILAEEEGFIKDLGPDPDVEGGFLKAQVQRGSYSYTAPNGEIITVTYTADETGYHPSGDHLPTPPPVSPEVQKGLDIIFAGIRAQQEAAERGLTTAQHNDAGHYEPQQQHNRQQHVQQQQQQYINRNKNQ